MTHQPLPGSISRRTIMQAGAVGLGAAAVSPLLAACGEEAKTPTASTAASGGASAAANVKQLGKEVSGVLYSDPFKGAKVREYPPFGNGATLTIVVPQDTTIVGDWMTNEATKWMEEKTGVKVNFKAVQVKGTDGKADLTKVNAMIASGDLPDAFMGINFTNAQVSLYGQQGLFIPLDAHIEKNAPELRQAFKDYPDLKGTLKGLDGKVYQIKTLTDCFQCRVGDARTYVNQVYLDKVGGKMPTTTDEMRELLKLFKAKNPTGRPDVMPLGGSSFDQLDTFFMNAFLYNPGASVDWMSLDNGKIKFAANTDEWRDALKYLRSLFDDGTLDPAVFTMTMDEYKAVGTQGRVCVARTYAQSLIAPTTDPNGLWSQYVAVPPLKGPKGVQYSLWDYNLVQGTPFVITNKCKDPGLAVQWVDFLLGLGAQLVTNYGVQGKGWEYAKEGEKGMSQKQATYKTIPIAKPEPGMRWGFQNMTYYYSEGWVQGNVTDFSKPNFGVSLQKSSEAYEKFKVPQKMTLPSIVFSDADAGTQSQISTTITTHVQESMAKFATGKLNINNDADWKAYVDALDKMRLNDLKAVYQKAVDALPK